MPHTNCIGPRYSTNELPSNNPEYDIIDEDFDVNEDDYQYEEEYWDYDDSGEAVRWEYTWDDGT